MMIVASILEMLNIGLIFPLAKVLVTPDDQPARFSLGFFEPITLLEGIKHPVLILVVILVGVILVKNAVVGYIVIKQSYFIAGVRAQFTAKMLEAQTLRSYEDHMQSNSSGIVYNLLFSAPSAVTGILQPTLSTITEVFLSMGVISALILVAPKETITVGVFVTIALSLYYYTVRSRLLYLGSRHIYLNKQVSKWAHFCLGSMKESIVSGNFDYFVEKVKALAREQTRVNATIQILNQIPRIVGEIIAVFALAGAAMFALSGDRTNQDVLALLALFAAATFKTLPSAYRIIHDISTLRRTTPVLNEIYEDIKRLVNVRRDNPHGSVGRQHLSVEFDKCIQLENVSYAYREAESNAITDVSLTINKGEVVAVVGSTGAGKSTLIDIILNLLPVSSGRILVDGKELSNDQYCKVGYVPQEIYLLDDTLRRNIAFGQLDTEIDDPRIDAILKMVKLDSMVSSLPGALDSNVGENGVRLSGGQRQRIGIARALYEKPDILVMDEATSALDPATERMINESLGELGNEVTVIIIAHRVSTVVACDRLFFIADGKLNDQGTYDELVERNPDYRNLTGFSQQ